MKNLILILLLFLMSCVSNGGKSGYLPTGAINITDKGNGWYSFELDGKKYLYQMDVSGNAAWSAITEVSE